MYQNSGVRYLLRSVRDVNEVNLTVHSLGALNAVSALNALGTENADIDRKTRANGSAHFLNDKI